MEEGSSLHGSNSKSESVSASSSSLNKLRKLLDRARHDVENMPGAELWRSEKVEEAMTMDKESMSCKKLKKSIACLRRHVTVRIAWLEMVRTDPLSLSTGWDLSRFWRFRCAIARFKLRGSPREIEEKFRTKGLVLLWKYMIYHWREEDRDVTPDEVSRNLRVFFQLEENRRIKLLEAEAAAALKRRKRRRPPPLRVEVLEKQARRHVGSGIVPKKKKKLLEKYDKDKQNNLIWTCRGVMVITALKSNLPRTRTHGLSATDSQGYTTSNSMVYCTELD